MLPDVISFNYRIKLSALDRLGMRLRRQMVNPDVNQHPKAMKRGLCLKRSLKSAVGWWEVLSLRSSQDVRHPA